MNLRWKAYVAPNPPKGAREEQKVPTDTLSAQYCITLRILALNGNSAVANSAVLSTPHIAKGKLGKLGFQN